MNYSGVSELFFLNAFITMVRMRRTVAIIIMMAKHEANPDISVCSLDVLLLSANNEKRQDAPIPKTMKPISAVS